MRTLLLSIGHFSLKHAPGKNRGAVVLETKHHKTLGSPIQTQDVNAALLSFHAKYHDWLDERNINIFSHDLTYTRDTAYIGLLTPIPLTALFGGQQHYYLDKEPGRPFTHATLSLQAGPPVSAHDAIAQEKRIANDTTLLNRHVKIWPERPKTSDLENAFENLLKHANLQAQNIRYMKQLQSAHEAGYRITIEKKRDTLLTQPTSFPSPHKRQNKTKTSSKLHLFFQGIAEHIKFQ